jgi:hypothetical protein
MCVAESVELSGYRAMPVYHGPEYVEYEGFNTFHAQELRDSVETQSRLVAKGREFSSNSESKLNFRTTLTYLVSYYYVTRM